MTTRTSSIVAVGPRLNSNAIGRVYSVWLTARSAGLDFTYVAAHTDGVWPPIAGATEFLDCVRLVDKIGDRATAVREELSARPGAACFVFKNLPRHVTIARRLQALAPVVLDVDDAELEAKLAEMPAVARAGLARPRQLRTHMHPWQLRRAISRSREFAVTVSNPALQALYPAVVLPHVRESNANATEESPSSDGMIELCFVGTPRPHKGLDELRSAAALLAQEHPVRLTITAPPRADAHPWERWVGRTSLQEGLDIVGTATVVVLPSRPGWWGDYQLPVKLVDALHAGKPLVVTSLTPLTWAAGDAALVVEPHDPAAIAEAVRSVALDQRLAEQLSAAATRRAAAFTPAATADALNEVLERANARNVPLPRRGRVR